MSAADLQRKINNAGACSHLDCAIWFIRQANKLWPFVHAAGLIETLEQLQEKIKAELSEKTEPATPGNL
jgi:hypothetical protein